MTTNSRTPAELQSALEAIIAELRMIDWDKAPAENLVPLALSLKAACDHGGMVHAQIELRAITNNTPVPGAALKDIVTHRRWHDQETAEQLAQEEFGDEAFTRSLKSPAQLEKMPGGETFVAVASYKPAAGKRVVY